MDLQAREDLRFINRQMARNCPGCDLARIELPGADLIRANLAEADPSGAGLSKANRRRANLRGARLVAANLAGADLGGADLQGADLSRAALSGANLYQANLKGAILAGAAGLILEGAIRKDGPVRERKYPIHMQLSSRRLARETVAKYDIRCPGTDP